ncbi:hypothetical protein SISNIDRAFT_487829 [Sistotremastrum niveocremeum HHB9708]|uniref:HNH nuclease domain-containing protein n=1 Tax=Sistotremastrum niveocremeum HHB9708 TaxID=1314777 RepID=A0A164S451_9AGAM|nr:hypothetical protein SISNIDRAFT_487829 [Sistotremastrum niveocremeum HHB9708]
MTTFVKRAYVNEDVRNIHIWSSRMKMGHNKVDAILVAGFFVSDDRPVSIEHVYQWLQVVAVPKDRALRPITPKVRIGPNGPREFVALVKLPNMMEFWDERNRFDHNGFTEALDDAKHEQHNLVLPEEVGFIQEGHYGLFWVKESTTTEDVQYLMEEIEFEKVASAISSRNTSNSRSGQDTSGSSGSRASTPSNFRHVSSDMCRISGQPAKSRNRGANFVGLHASHVYPVSHFADVGTIFTREEQKALKSRKLWDDFDQPFNVMILRSDIHAAFDKYEFGLQLVTQPDTGKHVHYVQIFERRAAISIREIEKAREEHLYLLPKARLRPREKLEEKDALRARDVSPIVLAQHFKTGLLWHVAGMGMEKPANAVDEIDLDADDSNKSDDDDDEEEAHEDQEED